MAVRPNKPGNHETIRVEWPEETAAKTMKTDVFKQACASHGVEPTKRQAAAYNAKRGRWAT